MPELVARRDVLAEPIPSGGGVECFDTELALAINRARLGHLAALGLPLDGQRVLEVGAGVGRLSGFFLERGCDLVVTEGRSENVDELRRRFPGVEAHEWDVETSLTRFGRFNVVFCYGLLYHLENPIQALRNMAEVCGDLLLIETMVCDSPLPVMRVDDETRGLNQALRGIANRPSVSYLAMVLNRIGFDHVYAPLEVPQFPDYQFEKLGNLDTMRGHPLRAVFVAARRELSVSTLAPLLSTERFSMSTTSTRAMSEAEAMRRTVSWRVTKPLRAIRRRMN
jgi:SAM-dependent methyltransferase